MCRHTWSMMTYHRKVGERQIHQQKILKVSDLLWVRCLVVFGDCIAFMLSFMPFRAKLLCWSSWKKTKYLKKKLSTQINAVKVCVKRKYNTYIQSRDLHIFTGCRGIRCHFILKLFPIFERDLHPNRLAEVAEHAYIYIYIYEKHTTNKNTFKKFLLLSLLT